MNHKARAFFKEPLFFYIIMLNYLRPPCLNDISPAGLISFFSLWDKYIGIPIVLLCIIAQIQDRETLIGDIATYYIYKIIGTIAVTFIASHAFTGGGAFHHLWTLSGIWYVALALKYNYRKTVKRLAYLLSILVFINFLTIIMFPGGMYFNGNYENYFLGYDNGHVVVFMPTLFFTLENATLRNRYALMISMWVFVFASAIICKSGVTLAGIGVLAFLLCIIRFPVVRKFLFNWKTVIIVVIGVFFAVIVFRMQLNYRDLIMQYFGKDVTFTGRTILWDRAFEYIKESPWLGTGDNTEANLGMFQLNTQRITYAHNEFLDVLVRSGAIGLVLYILCIIRTFKTIGEKWTDHDKTWLALMASYWIMMLAESYSNYSFYYLYFVMLYCPRVEHLIERSTQTQKAHMRLFLKRGRYVLRLGKARR